MKKFSSEHKMMKFSPNFCWSSALFANASKRTHKPLRMILRRIAQGLHIAIFSGMYGLE